MSDPIKNQGLGPAPLRRRWFLRPRLMLRVGVVIGFVIVFAVSSFYGRRNERMLELVQSGYFPSVKTGGELSMLLMHMQHGLLDAAESADADTLLEVDQTYNAFVATLNRAAANPVADRKRLGQLGSAVAQYYTLARQTTGQMIEGASFESLASPLALMKARQNTAVALLDDSIRRDDEAIRSAFAASRTTNRTTMTVMGTVIAACMAALLIGSLLSDRLHETRRRNEDLQQNRAELEREVGHRTRELTAATQALEVARDAAERVAEENAELSRRNRMILDAAGEGIFGLDGSGTVTFINPAAAMMLGWEVEQILGRTLHDVVHCARTADAADERCFLCRSASNLVSEITDFRTRGGSSIPVEYTASAILGDDGVETGVVVTFRDISARRAIERMKDEFVSTVNHELRTPLTSIRGALGLLNTGLIGPVGERGQRMLTIAVQNTDRLIRLINDILDLERIQSGKIDLDRGAVDANELMGTVMDGVHPLASQAGVGLLIEPTPAILWADNHRLVQTLTNLVSNAIKFSPAGTTVTVGGSEKNGEFTFHVSDRGRGIPADRLETIFERFQQVDASDARDKGGSGLGLAICRSIVDAHGGRIWAERREGGGTTFRFTIATAPRPHAAGRSAQPPLLAGEAESA